MKVFFLLVALAADAPPPDYYPTKEACDAALAKVENHRCVEFKVPSDWQEAARVMPPFNRPIEVIVKGPVPNMPKGSEFTWQGIVQWEMQPGEGDWSPRWKYLPKGGSIVFWREPTPRP